MKASVLNKEQSCSEHASGSEEGPGSEEAPGSAEVPGLEEAPEVSEAAQESGSEEDQPSKRHKPTAGSQDHTESIPGSSSPVLPRQTRTRITPQTKKNQSFRAQRKETQSSQAAEGC